MKFGKALQEALNAAGASPRLKTDGVYGDKTVTAVRQFQQRANIEVDGVAGPQTFASLHINV